MWAMLLYSMILMEGEGGPHQSTHTHTHLEDFALWMLQCLIS